MASEVIAAAGAVKIVITGEGASFSAVVADANRQLDKLGAKAQSSGRGMVTSVQAASGTIRLLEGDITRNVRAVEKFITMIPGVGNALKVAFPVVGAIALGGVLMRLGEEVQKFLKDVREGPSRIQDGFASMTLSSQLANDELRKNTDEIGRQIAKIEGKPVNGLALALDEARIMADRLQQSLDGAYQEQKKLLEENKAGVMELILGKGETGEVQGNIQNFFKLIRDAERNANAALHSATPGDAKQYQDQVGQLQKNAIAYANQQIGLRTGNVPIGTSSAPYAQLYGDQSKNLAALQGMRDLMYQEQDRAQLQAVNSQQTGKLATLQGAKDAAAQQLQAARQRLEAMKAEHTMNLDEEAAYWQKLADGAKRGSTLYNAAMMEANRARATSQTQYQQQFVSEIIQGIDARTREQESSDRINAALTESWDAAQKRDEEAAKQMRESAVKAFEEAERQRQAADKIEEERIRLDESMGRLSRLGAAQALQTLHAESFAQWSTASASFSQSFPDTPVPGASGALGQHGTQSEMDDAAVQSATALGALDNAANELTQNFLDSASKIRAIFDKAFSDFNKQVVDFLTMKHPREDFGSVGANLFRGVTSMGVERLEGTVMKSLGLGSMKKRQESNVWVQNWPGGAAGGSASSASPGGIIGKVLNWFGGSSGGTVAPSSSAASDVSSIGSLMASFPMMAAGGPISSNMPAIVGENGPELFMPSSSGRIIPNDALGGGGMHMPITVDARGSSDPAAMDAAVRRGIAAATPHIIAMGMKAQTDRNKRMPGTRRS